MSLETPDDDLKTSIYPWKIAIAHGLLNSMLMSSCPEATCIMEYDMNAITLRDEQFSTDVPRVFVVDDDVSVRDALSSLFESVGMSVRTFPSGGALLRERELLTADCPERPNCLICDVRMPCCGGLELQEHLTRNGLRISIVFMSGHGDVSMTVHAMKAGACDFLAKPFRDQDMLDAVQAAVLHDRACHRKATSLRELRDRYRSLTVRERQVFHYVTSGLMNKQAAYEMNLSEITVKVNRGHLMRKMKAKTLAELVRMEQNLRRDPPALAAGGQIDFKEEVE